MESKTAKKTGSDFHPKPSRPMAALNPESPCEAVGQTAGGHSVFTVPPL